MDRTQVCSRCARVVPPRGAAVPRYCPVCGAQLPLATAAQRSAPRPRVPVMAVVSLLLGLASLLFIRSGIPVGIFAIALGSSTRAQIRGSGGRLVGAGLTLAGIILGIITTVIWLRLVF
jgi:hypothetical protein